MALHVVAQPPAEFQAWLAAQAGPARDGARR
jgi:heme/copper-type cytochrome/quinol oxidase subunit 2